MTRIPRAPTCWPPAAPKPVDHDQLTFDFTTTTGGTA